MDVVILCGGKGSRLSEETVRRPKPMVEIGGKPILWHIMKTYSYYGYNRFVLALGYKSSYIKEYFYNLRITESDFSLKLTPNSKLKFFNESPEKNWEITFINTGEDTLKGGRLKRIEKYVKSDQFHLTYGDGVSDVEIDKLVNYHNSHRCIGTVTVVHPPSRFGKMVLENGKVMNFDEKPQMDTGHINGGFFVFEREVFSYFTRDEDCDFEFGPLQKIVKDNQLRAYIHDGFWQPMDNIREKEYLNSLVENNKAPWMQWKK